MAIFKSLANNMGIIILLAFIISKITFFKKLILNREVGLENQILLGMIFGVYGIIGTYIGTPVDGIFVSFRVIGIFVGGLLGGPLSGIIAASITALHIHFLDMSIFLAKAYIISGFIQGIFGGLLKKKIDKYDNKILFALLTGMMTEVFYLLVLLWIIKPFSLALNLVKTIMLPMVLINGLSIAVFIGLIENIFKEIEAIASHQSQLSLKIANRTLKHLRKGLNESTALETAKIIKEMTDIKAVSFTSRDNILAHIGSGEDHHLSMSPILTARTEEVLKDGKLIIANTKEDIACDFEACKLKSGIIAPLMEGDKVIGTLKLYKEKEDGITQLEVELAKGLVLLFSTQLELSKIDKQSELVIKAELKALQAQINPHFLFNAINTIVSLIRTKPEMARKLLIHLGDYFRNNLQKAAKPVSLEREIENINSYLEIEKARFGEKLNIIYNIENGVNCSLYPLLLQPIVENAVKHGVLKKLEGGTVEITAKDIDDETILTVKDNGIGMEKEDVDKLFIEDHNEDSIGLLNVQNRLKNRYGSEYGLEIESLLGKGTVVTLRIPKNIQGV